MYVLITCTHDVLVLNLRLTNFCDSVKKNLLCMVVDKCEECESGSERYTALLPNSYPNHANFH